MSRNAEERRAWGGEIGPVLREARESLGLSLKEAERSTRIRASYLDGVEQENPDELPGESYIQTFLRSYADFLGLDAEEMARRFGEHSGGLGQQAESRETTNSWRGERRGERRGNRQGYRGTLLMLSLTIFAMIFLVSALYVLGDAPRTVSDIFLSGATPTQDGSGEGELEEASPGSEPGATSDDSGGRDGVEPGSREAANLERESRPTQSLIATVSVSDAESWISIESEDGIEYTGIAQPGFSRSFDLGESFTITTGNAGAVELEINEQRYGRLGDSGEVTARSFTLKGGG